MSRPTDKFSIIERAIIRLERQCMTTSSNDIVLFEFNNPGCTLNDYLKSKQHTADELKQLISLEITVPAQYYVLRSRLKTIEEFIQTKLQEYAKNN